MGRRTSREVAVKLLYELEIQKNCDCEKPDVKRQIEFKFLEEEISISDKAYVMGVVEGVLDNVDLLDCIIKKHSKGWKIERIPRIDLSILRLGVYEINFRFDIPFTVSINEAIELAKKYSGKDSGSFINGILGKATER